MTSKTLVANFALAVASVLGALLVIEVGLRLAEVLHARRDLLGGAPVLRARRGAGLGEPAGHHRQLRGAAPVAGGSGWVIATYGANAKGYVDAFFTNLRSDEIDRRLGAATDSRAREEKS